MKTCIECGRTINEETISETGREYSICTECLTGHSDAEREEVYHDFEQLIAGDYR